MMIFARLIGGGGGLQPPAPWLVRLWPQRTSWAWALC